MARKIRTTKSPEERRAEAEGLHATIAEQVEELRSSEAWTRFLTFAQAFHRYSINNLLLILAQKPEATHVAGYRTWQKLGRQVRKGERGIRIFGGRDVRETVEDEQTGEEKEQRRVRFFPVSVFDMAQTDPIDPEADDPSTLAHRLRGDDPLGILAAVTDYLTGQGWTVEREAIPGETNGYTTTDGTRRVVVDADLSPAQAAKTALHDLLTAPTGPIGLVGGVLCAGDTPLGRVFAFSFMVVCWAHRHGSTGEGVVAEGLGSVGRDVKRLAVPIVGAVVTIDEVPGTAVVDASGESLVEVAEFFRGMLASGASPSSLRSYGLALLRWWRFLAAIGVPWERAGRVDAQDFVLWMRMVGPAGRVGGYAPATINHALAVVKSFYADRARAGQGPVINPVPDAPHRDGRRGQAHHNPLQPFAPGPRAAFRQKVPERAPRSIPDGLFDALFATVRSDRDRALLAFWVSTGARASELLGVTLDRVDPGEQRIGVVRKGSRRLQWLPASADAFVWLRLYEARICRPAGEQALWLTNRSPVRPLTYAAARRMLQRANDSLGTAWTLHDLRHTAAQRMIDDPALSLTDVQWVLGHAHLTTTQLYLRARPDEVIAKVLEHFQARAERPPTPPAPPVAEGYSVDVLDALLGGGRRG